MKSKKNEDAVKRVLIDAILDRHRAHNRTQRRLQNIGMRVAAQTRWARRKKLFFLLRSVRKKTFPWKIAIRGSRSRSGKNCLRKFAKRKKTHHHYCLFAHNPPRGREASNRRNFYFRLPVLLFNFSPLRRRGRRKKRERGAKGEFSQEMREKVQGVRGEKKSCFSPTSQKFVGS